MPSYFLRGGAHQSEITRDITSDISNICTTFVTDKNDDDVVKCMDLRDYYCYYYYLYLQMERFLYDM